MTNRERQHTGDLYQPMDPEILAEQTACLEKLYEYNQTRPSEFERRTELLREMFAEIGEDCYIEPRRAVRPLWAAGIRQLWSDAGGRHPHLCGRGHHVRS